MSIRDLPIVILAAGSSSRMRGRDKLMETIDGVPLLRLQAEKARAVTQGPVIVTLPAPPHPRHAVLAGLKVTPVAVPDAGDGMSASLRRGIAALPKGSPAAMILLADLPDLTREDLETVAEAVDFETDTLIWRGTTQTGAPGHPIVFRAALFDAFADLTGDRGASSLIALAGDRIAHIPLPGDHARTDLDTPEAWADWRARHHR